MELLAKTVYRKLHAYPLIVSAAVVQTTPESGQHVIHSTWKQQDLGRMENVTFSRSHVMSGDTVTALPPVVCSELTRSWSRSRRLCAVVRNFTPKKGEPQQYLEIWDDSHKLHNIDVSLLGHGKIHLDDQFYTLQWSPSEKKLLYVAEKKTPKNYQFFSTEEKKDDTTEGKEFEFQENWGEALVKVHQPVVCVLDIESTEVKILNVQPYDISPGQGVWKSDNEVVFVGWYNEPWRVGLIYCDNRKSSIFHFNIESDICESITGEVYASYSSPVFSLDGATLYYLQSKIWGPHQQAKQLMCYDWRTKETTVIMKQNDTAETPGLYGFDKVLTPGSWSSDGKQLLLNTLHNGSQVILSVEVSSGKATILNQDADMGCWRMLDIQHDVVVASCASLNQTPSLVTFTLPSAGECLKDFCRLTAVLTLDDVKWKSFNMTAAGDGGLPYQCILMEPISTCEKKPPLVVFCHGGPHSSFVTGFSPQFAGLVQCGFAVLMVNYRGSLGFGQSSVDSLPGNVGTNDVQDIQRAVVHVVETLQLTDPERTVVTGGSHGGFLTAHLIGQYPDYYKAAVTRNAVINIGSMATTTDIPDWCYVEAGLAYDCRNIADPETYKKMWDASPIRYVDQVRTPLLMMVGEVDQRVPPKQNHEYRKALQARGVKVKLLTYPNDSHPLASVDAESDNFVHMIDWFNQHI